MVRYTVPNSTYTVQVHSLRYKSPVSSYILLIANAGIVVDTPYLCYRTFYLSSLYKSCVGEFNLYLKELLYFLVFYFIFYFNFLNFTIL